jgi:hypothetical protein
MPHGEINQYDITIKEEGEDLRTFIKTSPEGKTGPMKNRHKPEYNRQVIYFAAL